MNSIRQYKIPISLAMGLIPALAVYFVITRHSNGNPVGIVAPFIFFVFGFLGTLARLSVGRYR